MLLAMLKLSYGKKKSLFLCQMESYQEQNQNICLFIPKYQLNKNNKSLSRGITLLILGSTLSTTELPYTRRVTEEAVSVSTALKCRKKNVCDKDFFYVVLYLKSTELSIV